MGDTIADGLAAPFAGHHTLAHVREFVDDILLVSDQEIVDAMRLILDRLKVVAEPAAAAALAPFVAGELGLAEGTRTVCVLCGGNIDNRRLEDLLARYSQQ
jgi:threonine dehydratase